MTRDFINPPSMPPAGPYSQVVRIGLPGADLVIVSGQVGTDTSGTLVGRDDIVAQSAQAMSNIQAAVEAAGGQLSNVVRTTTYLTDFSRLGELRASRERLFPSDPPASTTVQVAALFDPDALIEIDAMAVIARPEVTG